MTNAPPTVAPGEGTEELAALLREGTLAAEYPRVGRLLAGLSDDALGRAGRLLARLDPGEVLAAHPDTPAPVIAVTGHGTLSALVPALTAELARHGLLARVHLSDFDGWVLDLADPGSALYAARPSVTLCVLDPAVVADELPLPWRVADVERVLEEKLALAERLVGTFVRTAPGGTLVLNTLPLPRELTGQLVDLKARAQLGAVWREANARLLRLSLDVPEALVIDLDPLLAEGGPARDVRQSVYAKAHLSDGLLSAYAREAGHLARRSAGGTKKVLALDLDETVWGGVLGEVGPEGIATEGSYRGEAFQRFQRVAKQLSSQGVLLTAVSKNDRETVVKTLREHPGLALREADFVHIRANWRPKHSNLAEQAGDLNLSPDSFVFVDDSPFECGLVRRELPGTAVVQVGSEPALHVERLLRDGWFDVRELTDDDLVRPRRYREDHARQEFLHTFDSLDSYLRELDITVRLAPAGPQELARVSQLSLRTNQFNLTGQRLQPAETHALAEDPAALVLAVVSADRFGDNGLVGAVLLHREGKVLHIDNFLLSCRVFGRGIEQAVIAAVLGHAGESGAEEVRAEYRRTAKNGKVAGFYPRAGFEVVAEDASHAAFRHMLGPLPRPVGHIRLTACFERALHDAPQPSA
ncbi:HAD-IIIC family phosphatase [Streptomyces iconiensis]|uniref:HAD-IIIC family phosphatase n=1 Tax=Streptomyces iconiensis TaxID=1384038 RepID=A0ABT7A838_9ACTN|nr:HAD-IIIC family phosphatase [Streptomyces iconiensis]MDJ1137470.1 HAD-IIIC family phosphatase [Streptomyces iconiensis]